jgi:glycosyltransferase involved in cell wall biosynthesis
MVIGVVWQEDTSAAHYRAIDPMRTMERLGHRVVWPPDQNGRPSLPQLMTCDVIHVYRRFDDDTRDVMRKLAARGTAIVWDNDDDYASVPKESPDYNERGGINAQRYQREVMKTARLAHVVTTTSDVLATKFQRAGIGRVQVVPNQLGPGLKRKRRRHSGVVIGWVAGLEHLADASRLRVAATLRAALEQHPEARVECIGVDLQLDERYRHDAASPFERLPYRIGAFDIAIAPLADIPFNHARSDIKVKEYASCGVPWLASPVGPYAGLGEEQGGLLVPDDGWVDALDRLLSSPRERKKLARNGKSWAKHQRVETEAKRWEAVFAEASNLAGSREIAS